MSSRFAHADQFYWFFYVLLLAFAFFSPAFHSLKLLRVESTIPALITYSQLVLYPLLAGVSLSSLMVRGRLAFDFVDVVLITSLFWASVWTVMYGGSIDDIVGNTLRLLLAFFIYNTSRQYAVFWSRQRVVVLALVGFVGVLAGLFVVYVFGVFGPFSIYLGLSSDYALLFLAISLSGVLPYGLVWALVAIIAIILSGKRGVMLAAGAMLGVWFLIYWRRSGLRFVLSMFLFIPLALAVAVVLMSVSDPFSYLPSSIGSRFSVLSELSLSLTSLDQATSGRASEIVAVLRAWEQNPVSLLVGHGLGGVIELPSGVQHSTIHVSPIALAMLFGFPVAILMFLVILWRTGGAFFEQDTLGAPLRRAWILYVTGVLVVSLSSFVLLQNPVLWVALGVLAAKPVRQYVEYA